MINFLRQDFPFFTKNKKTLNVTLTLCSLSFLFVLFTGPIFAQPEQKPSSLAFIMLFMVFNSQLLLRVIIPFFFKSQFSEKKWTIGKEIIWMLLEIIAGIGFCYILLLWIWNVPDGFYLEITIENIIILFIGQQFFTIPLSIYIKRDIVLNDYLQKAKYLNMLLIKKKFDSELLNNLKVKVKLKSNDETENVELAISDILFLKGAHNYVEVYYLSDELVKRTLLRNTLKALFQDLEQFEVFNFCHRSYIINIQQVTTINGNSRGYKVLLKNYDEFIPVSRQKALEFEVAIGKIEIKQ
ncbi:LytR/AlgR family response regulator transcription factor [Maribacter sp. IgM3_T14_3]|uniref:LytR/AlgR family response regulator transcription factor n=1 Tax=Maribacter sp. IgM3_T14_3 TaxID=3415140 RepID=UPI003C6FD404